MNINRKIILPILIVGALLVLWRLTRNEMDSDWIRLAHLELEDISSLEKSEDSLQLLFEQFHGAEMATKYKAVELINEPYIPIMEYTKFEKYITALQKGKRIVISTVEGGGATTLIDRLARFIAVDKSRIMNVMCSPKFDLLYHEKYIGKYIDDRFEKGELLMFWEECLRHPEYKYIAIFDDIDKINPETLFGPDLWENFGNNKHKTFIGKQRIEMPDNFYMVSTTLSALGSRIHLHNEHFKRIGRSYYLAPNTIDLALYIDRSRKKMIKKVAASSIDSLSNKDRIKYDALTDKRNILEYLFLFEKINRIIEKDVTRNSQLAQWSNLRKLYYPKQREELIGTIITHVNAISPEKHFDRESFEPVFYTINHDGLKQGSSPLARWFKIFKEWGFLTEFVVAICFALATALITIYMNGKRKKQVTKFLTRSEKIYAGFESRTLDTDMAIQQLDALKVEIENYTRDNKISFPEAIFFYDSVRSKVSSIEITKNINSTFLILMEVFLEDNILSLSEYQKLITFLDRIEFKIPKNDFQKMKDQVNHAWKEFGEK